MLFEDGSNVRISKRGSDVHGGVSLFGVLRKLKIQFLKMRNRRRVNLPAEFLLIASTTRCPCGFSGDPKRNCRCPPELVQRFWRRWIEPTLRYFDIVAEMMPLTDRERRERNAPWQSPEATERCADTPCPTPSLSTNATPSSWLAALLRTS